MDKDSNKVMKDRIQLEKSLKTKWALLQKSDIFMPAFF